jgi:hypothetical protein
MATLECKLAMCISRLVEFELLLEFKQKNGTSLHTTCYKDASKRKQSVRGQSVCLSQLYIYIFTHRTSGNCPVTSDFFSGTALGSSRLPVKARFIFSLSLYQNDLVKIFIYFYFFIHCVFFTSKKYALIFI